MKEGAGFSSVTHYTHVEVQPGGINIQNVEHLYQADILKQLGIELEVKSKGEAVKNDNENINDNKEELFHFVHPEIEDNEACHIHNVVKRLITQHGIQEICQHLYKMSLNEKILLPQNPSIAYKELTRIGMPDGDGFNLKTFQKYYKK